jgi:chaperonin GroEL
MSQLYYRLTGKEFQEDLIKAFKTIENVISSSYGYDGAYTIMVEEGLEPIATNDGYLILRNFVPSNASESVAHKLLMQSAERTNMLAGDATTATIILSSQIACRVLTQIMEGISPSKIKKSLSSELQSIIDKLNSIKIKDIKQSDVFNLAKTSTRSEQIAKIICDLFTQTEGGTQEIIKSDRDGIYLEITEGLNFPNYFLHNLLKPDNKEQIFDIENPSIYITNVALSNSRLHLENLVAYAYQNKIKDLVIIAPEFEGDTLSYIINRNHSQKQLRIYPVLTPSTVANARAEVNYDLVAMLGGSCIDNEQDLANPYAEDFGSCNRMLITNTKCSILGVNKDKESVKVRLEQIDHTINNANGELRIDSLKMLLERRKRLKLLTGLLKVGARTNTESEANYRMVEDAVRSIQSAKEKGLCLGFANAYSKLGLSCNVSELTVLQEILLTNSFGNKKEIYDNNDTTKGINLETGEIVDLREAGIIDNAFAVEEAIRNAYSLGLSCIAQNYFYKGITNEYGL